MAIVSINQCTKIFLEKKEESVGLPTLSFKIIYQKENQFTTIQLEFVKNE